MAGSLGVGECADLDGSVMDPINHTSAFKGLKLFIKDLDSNTLPPFLARLCEPKRQSSYSLEEILFIFETAAQVHGRDIVPHIGQIVLAVIRILASGSLHSADCSKLICTLSRYGIDPLGREEEKSGILSSLGRPLSDCLMNTNKGISSGSALCITALVQSNNWQFASNELIDNVCLKVSGALEEAHCQTVVHLSLVVALSKHNPLRLEPYGRSLIRSGLKILDDGTKARNSQMIMASTQMIHSIMKSLDVRIISSEIDSIIHALEQCQYGFISDICTAALQAAETAKLLGMQEECGDGKRFSPLPSSSGKHSRKGSNSPIDDADMGDSGSSGIPCEMQSVHSFSGFDSEQSVACARRQLWSNGPRSSHGMSNNEIFHTSAPDSHDDLGVRVQSGSPCELQSVHSCSGFDSQQSVARARRQLWSNRPRSSHGMSNNEIVHNSAPDSHDDLGVRRQSSSADLVKVSRRYSGVFTGTGDPCPTCLTPRATNQCSQVYRQQALSDDIKIQSTPRKQRRYFPSCKDSERDDHHLPESPAFSQRQCAEQCTDHVFFQKNGEFEEREGCRNPVQQGNQWNVQSTDLLAEDLKFPTNSRHSDSDSARTTCEESQTEHEKLTRRKKRETNCFNGRLFPFVCVVLIIAMLLAWWKQDLGNELYVVPT